MNKFRFEAFSDAVFAFAITLLVLGLALPEFRQGPTERELTQALLRLWPNLLAYALSFAVIAIMWQNHHALFRLIHTVDRRTVFLNFLLLGVTVFIPFATSVLGAHPAMRASTFLYGLTLTASSSAYLVLLMHLIRTRAFEAAVPEPTLRQTLFAYRLGWATYTAAMLCSLVAPRLSFALYLLVAVYFLVPRGLDTDLHPARAGA
ncbi:MAG TPA: TMEM175 family protein [Geothrix sp.]|nr:TMEM175 family protein [Geothrix sp.]